MMSLATDLAAALAADARLTILRELAQQVDGRLSDVVAKRVLDLYGMRRDSDWVRTQLRKLEALGAVELETAGPMLIARITRPGRDHVEERAVIEGITRPAETG